MNIHELIKKIQAHIEPILNESGSIIFSSVDTISKGDIYTLGLNPGGDDGIHISETLSQLPLRKQNAYTDECWGNGKNPNYPKGQHPFQHNYTELFRKIGYNPENIFSSNLIFTRSRGQYGANYPKGADICWPVHKEFIKIIDPKCFIVFGNSKISPFQYIKTIYPHNNIDSIDSGHGKWKCYSCKGFIEGKERLLIGVPHLSRYYIGNHDKVINWITSKFK